MPERIFAVLYVSVMGLTRCYKTTVLLHLFYVQVQSDVYFCNGLDISYHRLRGSASPVLTATGFVNKKEKFSTPHRVDTPWLRGSVAERRSSAGVLSVLRSTCG